MCVAASAFMVCKLLKSVIVAFPEWAIACFSIAGMIAEAQAVRTVCLLSTCEGKDFFKSSELREYVFFFDI